jgi:hypothetical protein
MILGRSLEKAGTMGTTLRNEKQDYEFAKHFQKLCELTVAYVKEA